MKKWILLLLILLTGVARGEESNLKSQPELLWALSRAKTIQITGYLGDEPGDNGTTKPFDITLADPQKIREINWVFKNAALQADPHWTSELKAGAKLRTPLQARIIIDKQFVFHLLAQNLVVLAGSETLRATRYDKDGKGCLADDLRTALFRE